VENGKIKVSENEVLCALCRILESKCLRMEEGRPASWAILISLKNKYKRISSHANVEECGRGMSVMFYIKEEELE